jgi:hypothetical protein
LTARGRRQRRGLQELSLFALLPPPMACHSLRRLRATVESLQGCYGGFITSSMTKQKSQNSVRWRFSGSSPSGHSCTDRARNRVKSKVRKYSERCSEMALQRGAAAMARSRHTRAALSTYGVRPPLRSSRSSRSFVFVFIYLFSTSPQVTFLCAQSRSWRRSGPATAHRSQNRFKYTSPFLDGELVLL